LRYAWLLIVDSVRRKDATAASFLTFQVLAHCSERVGVLVGPRYVVRGGQVPAQLILGPCEEWIKYLVLLMYGVGLGRRQERER